MLSLLLSTAGVLLETARLGPFGLAFPSLVRESTVLNCSSTRGRPFVTGLHVTRVHAPLSGRQALEFRIQCGSMHSSAWSTLGPSTLPWATSQQGSVVCPQPQSASGLQVTRGHEPGALWFRGEDHFGFTLLCGDNNAFVEMEGLEPIPNVDETRGHRCPADSLVSAIEVNRTE